MHLRVKRAHLWRMLTFPPHCRVRTSMMVVRRFVIVARDSVSKLEAQLNSADEAGQGTIDREAFVQVWKPVLMLEIFLVGRDVCVHKGLGRRHGYTMQFLRGGGI